MNTETGEIRRMTPEERDRLNREAGKNLWVPLPGKPKKGKVSKKAKRRGRAW